MPVITLHGCPPEPLGNYLKALGVFRLVAEQADPATRAWWQGGVLRVLTRFDDAALRRFFLGSDATSAAFRPTPIFAPWGGRPGYYLDGSNADPRARVMRLKRARKTRKQLQDAAATLAELRRILCRHREWNQKQKKELRPWLKADAAKKDKDLLIAACRNMWPRRAVEWLDACLAPDVEVGFGALFGTGGNEGSADITNNYWYFVEECIGFPIPSPTSPEWLSAALVSSARTSGLKESAGQHFPAAAAGENIGQGFTGAISTNPWDVILAMEGAVLFAGAVTKRLANHGRGKAAFPFMLDHVATDQGAESSRDEQKQDAKGSKCKAEFWMPIWEAPLALGELRALLAEGRLQTASGNPAVHSTQALEAIAGLGISAGISAFRRVGLFVRRGTNNIAATLDEVPVPKRRFSAASNLEELSVIRQSAFARLREGPGVPDRILRAKQRLESAIARIARRGCLEIPPSAPDLQAVLAAVAALERECALTESARAALKPCASLSRRWINRTHPACCLDDTPECHLALAVASLLPWGKQPRQPAVGSLRRNLLPVLRHGAFWRWDEKCRSSVWSDGAPLLDNLTGALHRRLVDAERGDGDGLPLWSFYGASFSGLLALWRGEADEDRLAELVHALALVDFRTADSDSISAWQGEHDRTPSLAQSGVWFDGDTPRLSLNPDAGLLPPGEIEAAFALPRAYALLKLCFVGGRLPSQPVENRLSKRSGNEPFPNSPLRLLNLLRAGRGTEALLLAAQSLRAKGYPAIVREDALRKNEWSLSLEESRRLAGFLLIPVRHAGVLAALCTKPKTN